MGRNSGILMHISSLPSKYGIGTLGNEAYRFADFLKRSGQKYWQVLPIGPTGFGDSPYQSFSSYAGNPYFIDLEMLAEQGHLSLADIDGVDWGGDPQSADFGKIYKNRSKVLRKAFEKGFGQYKGQIEKFRYENRDWLEDYALFMALKGLFGMKPWSKWPDEDIKKGSKARKAYYGALLKDDIDFWIYIQFQFFQQWKALKKYVNEAGIRIIGDLPIYVSVDSADIWADPDIFWLDKKMEPVCVAGCPPDFFSRTGQLWGNPLYDWARLKKTGYKWWLKRAAAQKGLYDVVRIDHFRGFESYYAIPGAEKTAENGTWLKGPGKAFVDILKKEASGLSVIAEDLGYITPEVRRLVTESGYPGMKVLQFAFDSREPSDYLPHNYDKNCVVYTGTHDNDTAAGWFSSAPPEDVKFAKEYLGAFEEEGYAWGLIRAAYSSVAGLAIAQMQDFLELGSEARMNIPSTLGGRNWRWRMKRDALTDELAERIMKLTKLYGR